MFIAGIAAFWVFGNAQPVAVVANPLFAACRTCLGKGVCKCPKCGGTGLHDADTPCPKCRGTGKGEWFFKSKQKSSIQSKPICTACKGAGKKPLREQCAQCNGAGAITCPDCKDAGSGQKSKTVRAGLSPWEKTFAYCMVKPDKNCKPQRKLDGSYPLITKYIEVFSSTGRDMRVVKWDSAGKTGTEWTVRTRIEFKNNLGQFVQQSWEFIIENREVKGHRKIEWTGQ